MVALQNQRWLPATAKLVTPAPDLDSERPASPTSVRPRSFVNSNRNQTVTGELIADTLENLKVLLRTVGSRTGERDKPPAVTPMGNAPEST